MHTIKVTTEILSIVEKVKNLAIDYEQYFHLKRKLGITGEVGEIIACHLFKLSLVKNGIKEGYDALDSKGKLVQIKSVRKQPGKIQNPNSIGVALVNFQHMSSNIVIYLSSIETMKYKKQEKFRTRSLCHYSKRTKTEIQMLGS